jgi:hypothetical protein
MSLDKNDLKLLQKIAVAPGGWWFEPNGRSLRPYNLAKAGLLEEAQKIWKATLTSKGDSIEYRKAYRLTDAGREALQKANAADQAKRSA